MKGIFIRLCAVFCVIAGSVLTAHASPYSNPIILLNGSGNPIDNIPDFLLAIVDLVILIGTPIIVIFIIYGGFLFVTAGDNETQISKAKTAILWTLVGAAVLLGAKVIELAVQATIMSL